LQIGGLKIELKIELKIGGDARNERFLRGGASGAVAAVHRQAGRFPRGDAPGNLADRAKTVQGKQARRG
jgi:hypothetical protein